MSDEIEIKELLDRIDENIMRAEAENDDKLVAIIEEGEVTDTPISEAELKKAEKIITDNDEIAQFNKEVLGQLESPLIVHKKSDASYEDTASAFEMNETHTDEERPTLKRHRFRKEPKKKSSRIAPLFVIVVIIAVITGLYYSGVIAPHKTEKVSEKVEKTTEITTSIEQAYQGKIVIKGTYIFVDGVEVNGIEGLQAALKYVDPSPTAYEIVKEDANSDFLNNDVLPLMLDMGFYGEDTVISTIASTGLIAEAETTTEPISTEAVEKQSENAEN